MKPTLSSSLTPRQKLATDTVGSDKSANLRELLDEELEEEACDRPRILRVQSTKKDNNTERRDSAPSEPNESERIVSHAALDSDPDGCLAATDVVFFQCRVLEAFVDLQSLRTLRSLRPLMPIVVLTPNDNEEFRLACYTAGASDVCHAEPSARERLVKAKALYRLAASASLVEVQNITLLNSMERLQSLNDQLKAEITARDHAEVAREKSQAMLLISERMASLGEMAGGIAHEINNPLAVIGGRAEQILDLLDEAPSDTGEIRAATESIISVVGRIATIIRGLVTFARNGEKDPFTIVSGRQIVETTLSLCSERYKSNGVEVLVEDMPEEANLECREVQISQILANLLNNAFDAVRDTESPWIKIAMDETEDKLAFIVTDCGTGIPDTIIKRIFEPFFTSKEVGKGTGLGLSISSGIAEDHGGRLFYELRQGHTSFVLQLPKRVPSTVIDHGDLGQPEAS